MDASEIARLTRLLARAGLTAAQIAEEALRPHDLTLAQFAVLDHLVNRPAGPPPRQVDIARALGLGRPAITKIIAKFTARGWLIISPSREDLRVNHVVPGDLAIDALVAAQRSLAAAMSPPLGALTFGERRDLGRGLAAFVEAVPD